MQLFTFLVFLVVQGSKEKNEKNAIIIADSGFLMHHKNPQKNRIEIADSDS